MLTDGLPKVYKSTGGLRCLLILPFLLVPLYNLFRFVKFRFDFASVGFVSGNILQVPGVSVLGADGVVDA